MKNIVWWENIWFLFSSWVIEIKSETSIWLRIVPKELRNDISCFQQEQKNRPLLSMMKILEDDSISPTNCYGHFRSFQLNWSCEIIENLKLIRNLKKATQIDQSRNLQSIWFRGQWSISRMFYMLVKLLN